VGSTYFRFSCANCQKSLGLYYLTTSKELDDLREMFSFNYESVTLYEVGKAQHGVSGHIPPTACESSSLSEENTATDADVQSSSSSACEQDELSEREEIERVSKARELKLVVTFLLSSPDIFESDKTRSVKLYGQGHAA
jgi:hypothetical protein